MNPIPGLHYMVTLTCTITDELPRSAIERLRSDLTLTISGLQHYMEKRDIVARLTIVLMADDKPLWRLTTNALLDPIRVRGPIEKGSAHLLGIYEAIVRLITDLQHPPRGNSERKTP